MNGNNRELTLASILRMIYTMAWDRFQYGQEREALAEDAFLPTDRRVLIALLRAAETNLEYAETALVNRPKTADQSEIQHWETVIYVIKEQMKRASYR